MLAFFEASFSRALINGGLNMLNIHCKFVDPFHPFFCRNWCNMQQSAMAEMSQAAGNSTKSSMIFRSYIYCTSNLQWLRWFPFASHVFFWFWFSMFDDSQIQSLLKSHYLFTWLVVWNIFYFPIDWKSSNPNWQTHMFQRGLFNHQPVMVIPWKLPFFLHGEIHGETNPRHLHFFLKEQNFLGVIRTLEVFQESVALAFFFFSDCSFRVKKKRWKKP